MQRRKWMRGKEERVFGLLRTLYYTPPLCVCPQSPHVIYVAFLGEHPDHIASVLSAGYPSGPGASRVDFGDRHGVAGYIMVFGEVRTLFSSSSSRPMSPSHGPQSMQWQVGTSVLVVYCNKTCTSAR